MQIIYDYLSDKVRHIDIKRKPSNHEVKFILTEFDGKTNSYTITKSLN